MNVRPHIRFVYVLVLTCVVATACTTAPTTNNNQRNGNVAASTVSQSNSANSAKPSQQPDQSTTGSIEVTSVPPGARVLLISTEGGAGEPQPKGLTPTTITGLQPGKYTIDLEKPGYKSFQKELEAKPGKTQKINATLKKQ